eukprot:SAG11_NODE_984_length_6296_cov_3.033887_1_plen_68_part_00
MCNSCLQYNMATHVKFRISGNLRARGHLAAGGGEGARTAGGGARTGGGGAETFSSQFQAAAVGENII